MQNPTLSEWVTEWVGEWGSEWVSDWLTDWVGKQDSNPTTRMTDNACMYCALTVRCTNVRHPVGSAAYSICWALEPMLIEQCKYSECVHCCMNANGVITYTNDNNKRSLPVLYIIYYLHTVLYILYIIQVHKPYYRNSTVILQYIIYCSRFLLGSVQ